MRHRYTGNWDIYEFDGKRLQGYPERFLQILIANTGAMILWSIVPTADITYICVPPVWLGGSPLVRMACDALCDGRAALDAWVRETTERL